MGFLRTPDKTKIPPDDDLVPIYIIEPSSSSDEDEVQPTHQLMHQPRRPSQPKRKRISKDLRDDFSCRKCKVGRRWSRRIDNHAFLQNLIKGEEEYEDIVEQQATVFDELVCNENAMKIWETFMSRPEAEQHDFLTNQITKIRKAKERRAKKTSENQLDGPVERRKFFKRIHPFVQKFLNSEEMPKRTLLSLESCIIDFFLAEPLGEYVSDPMGNCDRKVLHGLAQYLDLNSQSFNSKVSCDYRRTKVTNYKHTFTAPHVLLSEFLGIS